MSAFEIFGTIGTVLAILAIIHNNIKGRLPRARMQRLADLTARTEEYHEIIRDDGLFERLHALVAVSREERLYEYRRRVESLQQKCREAESNLLWQYQMMFTGETRQIDELAKHVDGLRQELFLYSTRQNHWEKALVPRLGVVQRLHISQSSALTMRRALLLHVLWRDDVIKYHAHPLPFRQVFLELRQSGGVDPHKTFARDEALRSRINSILCTRGLII
ncbi:hypothetical protein DENSPDRAFT_836261 [Dentipellis sp. KUC8613]|nr:hypothetical protein DENSPDRAFT_836261 [Dentipellis sp. KUC8613]